MRLEIFEMLNIAYIACDLMRGSVFGQQQFHSMLQWNFNQTDDEEGIFLECDDDGMNPGEMEIALFLL